MKSPVRIAASCMRALQSLTTANLRSEDVHEDHQFRCMSLS